ncbi:hypothetical protein ACWFMI_12550 [Nocardiopsis terrae]
MKRPKIRPTCCLCGRTLPQRADVYVLDAEWQRRHPDMVGILACRCAITQRWFWRCDGGGPRYVAGHIPAASDGPRCIDSWSHISVRGTPVYAVTSYPFSALQQGAEEYLRHTAHRRGVNAGVARELQEALAEWDARDSLTNGRL